MILENNGQILIRIIFPSPIKIFDRKLKYLLIYYADYYYKMRHNLEQNFQYERRIIMKYLVILFLLFRIIQDDSSVRMANISANGGLEFGAKCQQSRIKSAIKGGVHSGGSIR